MEHFDTRCQVCQSTFKNIADFNKHLHQLSHRQKLEELFQKETFKCSGHYPFSTVVEHLAKKDTKSPIIGLSLLTLCLSTEFSTVFYLCHVCEEKCEQKWILRHLISDNHYINYYSYTKPNSLCFSWISTMEMRDILHFDVVKEVKDKGPGQLQVLDLPEKVIKTFEASSYSEVMHTLSGNEKLVKLLEAGKPKRMMMQTYQRDHNRNHPLLGMQHIVECACVGQTEKAFYLCTLCREIISTRMIIKHVLSFDHIFFYFEAWHPKTLRVKTSYTLYTNGFAVKMSDLAKLSLEIHKINNTDMKQVSLEPAVFSSVSSLGYAEVLPKLEYIRKEKQESSLVATIKPRPKLTSHIFKLRCQNCGLIFDSVLQYFDHVQIWKHSKNMIGIFGPDSGFNPRGSILGLDKLNILRRHLIQTEPFVGEGLLVVCLNTQDLRDQGKPFYLCIACQESFPSDDSRQHLYSDRHLVNTLLHQNPWKLPFAWKNESEVREILVPLAREMKMDQEPNDRTLKIFDIPTDIFGQISGYNFQGVMKILRLFWVTLHGEVPKRKTFFTHERRGKFPLLGQHFIVKYCVCDIKLRSKRWAFLCLLCEKKLPENESYIHIFSWEHAEQYVKRVHPGSLGSSKVNSETLLDLAKQAASHHRVEPVQIIMTRPVREPCSYHKTFSVLAKLQQGNGALKWRIIPKRKLVPAESVKEVKKYHINDSVGKNSGMTEGSEEDTSQTDTENCEISAKKLSEADGAETSTKHSVECGKSVEKAPEIFAQTEEERKTEALAKSASGQIQSTSDEKRQVMEGEKTDGSAKLTTREPSGPSAESCLSMDTEDGAESGKEAKSGSSEAVAKVPTEAVKEVKQDHINDSVGKNSGMTEGSEEDTSQTDTENCEISAKKLSEADGAETSTKHSVECGKNVEKAPEIFAQTEEERKTEALAKTASEQIQSTSDEKRQVVEGEKTDGSAELTTREPSGPSAESCLSMDTEDGAESGKEAKSGSSEAVAKGLSEVFENRCDQHLLTCLRECAPLTTSEKNASPATAVDDQDVYLGVADMNPEIYSNISKLHFEPGVMPVKSHQAQQHSGCDSLPAYVHSGVRPANTSVTLHAKDAVRMTDNFQVVDMELSDSDPEWKRPSFSVTASMPKTTKATIKTKSTYRGDKATPQSNDVKMSRRLSLADSTNAHLSEDASLPRLSNSRVSKICTRPDSTETKSKDEIGFNTTLDNVTSFTKSTTSIKASATIPSPRATITKLTSAVSTGNRPASSKPTQISSVSSVTTSNVKTSKSKPLPKTLESRTGTASNVQVTSHKAAAASLRGSPAVHRGASPNSEALSKTALPSQTKTETVDLTKMGQNKTSTEASAKSLHVKKPLEPKVNIAAHTRTKPATPANFGSEHNTSHTKLPDSSDKIKPKVGLYYLIAVTYEERQQVYCQLCSVRLQRSSHLRNLNHHYNFVKSKFPEWTARPSELDRKLLKTVAQLAEVEKNSGSKSIQRLKVNSIQYKELADLPEKEAVKRVKEMIRQQTDQQDVPSSTTGPAAESVRQHMPTASPCDAPHTDDEIESNSNQGGTLAAAPTGKCTESDELIPNEPHARSTSNGNDAERIMIPRIQDEDKRVTEQESFERDVDIQAKVNSPDLVQLKTGDELNTVSAASKEEKRSDHSAPLISDSESPHASAPTRHRSHEPSDTRQPQERSNLDLQGNPEREDGKQTTSTVATLKPDLKTPGASVKGPTRPSRHERRDLDVEEKPPGGTQMESPVSCLDRELKSSGISGNMGQRRSARASQKDDYVLQPSRHNPGPSQLAVSQTQLRTLLGKPVAGRSSLSTYLKVLDAKTVIGLGSVWECRGTSMNMDTFFLCESCKQTLSRSEICKHMVSSEHHFNYMRRAYPKFLSFWFEHDLLEKMKLTLLEEVAGMLSARERFNEMDSVVILLSQDSYHFARTAPFSEALNLVQNIKKQKPSASYLPFSAPQHKGQQPDDGRSPVSCVPTELQAAGTDQNNGNEARLTAKHRLEAAAVTGDMDGVKRRRMSPPAVNTHSVYSKVTSYPEQKQVKCKDLAVRPALKLQVCQPEAPASQRQPEAPASQRQPEAPASQRLPEAPASQRLPEAPASQRQPEAPASQRQPEAPASQRQPEAPASQRLPEAPASQKLPEAPASQKLPEAPASQKLPEAPASQKLPEAPASQRQPEAPASQRLPEAPASQKLPEAPASQRQPTFDNAARAPILICPEGKDGEPESSSNLDVQWEDLMALVRHVRAKTNKPSSQSVPEKDAATPSSSANFSENVASVMRTWDTDKCAKAGPENEMNKSAQDSKYPRFSHTLHKMPPSTNLLATENKHLPPVNTGLTTNPSYTQYQKHDTIHTVVNTSWDSSSSICRPADPNGDNLPREDPHSFTAGARQLPISSIITARPNYALQQCKGDYKELKYVELNQGVQIDHSSSGINTTNDGNAVSKGYGQFSHMAFMTHGQSCHPAFQVMPGYTAPNDPSGSLYQREMYAGEWHPGQSYPQRAAEQLGTLTCGGPTAAPMPTGWAGVEMHQQQLVSHQYATWASTGGGGNTSLAYIPYLPTDNHTYSQMFINGYRPALPTSAQNVLELSAVSDIISYTNANNYDWQ